MQLKPENLRHILGLKLRKYRQRDGLGLKDMAQRSGLSISYLSEIEKGRKYPKPEKILALALALGVDFDDLVSLKVDDELGPLRELVDSALIQTFPFHLFGIEMERLLSLVTEEPSKARALLRTALEIGRTYDARIEHFFYAALRSYQHLHRNYFKDIEQAAAAFLVDLGWAEDHGPPPEELEGTLVKEYGYEVTYGRFGRFPELRGLRSVWVAGRPPRLMIDERLLPSQKAFQLAREIGYLRLGLKERSATSSPLHVDSFDQVIHDFKAAYFSGAVMIRKDPLVGDLRTVFERGTWAPADFLALLDKYRTTPETFFYRLSQVVPRFLGLEELFFLRFHHRQSGDDFLLTKILNMSGLPIVHGLEPGEHYCRRWTGVRLLAGLAAGRGTGAPPPGTAEAARGEVWAGAQRARFEDDGMEFLVLSLSRPLVLSEDTHSSVSLGFLIDRKLKRRVGFWNDSAVPQVDVHLTCERCGLECAERAAAPRLHDLRRQRRRREEQLARLAEELTTGAASS